MSLPVLPKPYVPEIAEGQLLTLIGWNKYSGYEVRHDKCLQSDKIIKWNSHQNFLAGINP